MLRLKYAFTIVYMYLKKWEDVQFLEKKGMHVKRDQSKSVKSLFSSLLSDYPTK